MGLEEYAGDVEDVAESVEENFSREGFRRLKNSLDYLLPVVLLIVGFIVLFEFFIPLNQSMQIWINRLNWFLITYFGLRLLVSYRLSKNPDRFVEEHWLDILLVVPVFSVVQEARLLKYFKAVEELPVIERGVLSVLRSGSGTESAANAARMTRISRIIKKSV